MRLHPVRGTHLFVPAPGPLAAIAILSIKLSSKNIAKEVCLMFSDNAEIKLLTSWTITKEPVMGSAMGTRCKKGGGLCGTIDQVASAIRSQLSLGGFDAIISTSKFSLVKQFIGDFVEHFTPMHLGFSHIRQLCFQYIFAVRCIQGQALCTSTFPLACSRRKHGAKKLCGNDDVVWQSYLQPGKPLFQCATAECLELMLVFYDVVNAEEFYLRNDWLIFPENKQEG
jgi:hypothetical protein